MSNYHVLETNESDCQSRIAFHISVPDENNGIGVNLRTALKQMLDGLNPTERVISQVSWLETDFATEYTAIQNGEIYEHIVVVRYSANLTLLQKRNKMDNRYTALASAIPDRIRSKLMFWGFNRDVP